MSDNEQVGDSGGDDNEDKVAVHLPTDPGPYGAGVDVVIVNYRTPDDLIRAVRSFADVQWEVMSRLAVVNVAPTSADHEAYEEIEELIEVPSLGLYFDDNVGYAAACNGVGFLLHDYQPNKTVAFFNADVEFRPGVLDACHWRLHDDRDLAVIGPRQVNRAGKITHAGIIGSNEEPKLRGWKQADRGQFSGFLDDCVSVSGSAYFVKRRVWDELTLCSSFREVAPDAIGAFLPTQHYYEETWCSYHARAHGYKVAYAGEVSMVHEWHQASPQGSTDTRRAFESRRRFRAACDHHGIAHD